MPHSVFSNRVPYRDKVHTVLNVWLQEPHVQRDKERLAKKLDAPKETFVMPEVAKYDYCCSFNLLLLHHDHILSFDRQKHVCCLWECGINNNNNNS